MQARPLLTLMGETAQPPTIRSPLRYPGSKARLAKTIRSFLPDNLTELVCPFLGGGSVELFCAARDIRVHAADAFEPLVNFWRHALRAPGDMAVAARDYYPLTREGFAALRDGYYDMEDGPERAVAFYVLNRASYAGLTLANRSTMTEGHDCFTPAAMYRLSCFSAPGLSVECADYRDTLARHPDAFLYLDPPYPVLRNVMYGSRTGDMHKDFDHAALADALKQRDRWALSYNDCEMVRDLYAGYRIVRLTHAYVMHRKERTGHTDLLVLNP